MSLYKDIQSAINKHSVERLSDTPDFILAQYLKDCLDAWNRATRAREKWSGRERKAITFLPGEELPPPVDESPAPMVHQYFYRQHRLRQSLECSDEDCWHDEGTGPLPDLIRGADKFYTWRVKR